jgi:CRAL/TRIO domain
MWKEQNNKNNSNNDNKNSNSNNNKMGEVDKRMEDQWKQSTGTTSRDSMTSSASGASKSSKESSKKSKSKSPKTNLKKTKLKGLTDQKKGTFTIPLSDQSTGASAAFTDFVVNRSSGADSGSGTDHHYDASFPPKQPQSSTSTPQTSKSSTTMESYDQAYYDDSFDQRPGAPPVSDIHIEQEAQMTIRCGPTPNPNEKKAMAAFHGEMLQSFLTRHGRDEKLAMEQAMLFEAFLKSQVDVTQLGGLNQSSTSLNRGATPLKDLHDDDEGDEEESRMEQVESLFDDGDIDSFAPDTAWDNGSFQSFPASRHGTYTVPTDDSFGRMRRNETFMRQKSNDESDMKPRPKNLVARSQARGVPTSSSALIAPPPFMPPPPTMDRKVMSAGVTTRKVVTAGNVPDMRRRSLPSDSESPQPILHGGSRLSIGGRSTETSRSLPTVPVSKMYRSFDDQVNEMTMAQRSCVFALKTTWEQCEGKSKPFPNIWYIKFAKCSPGTPYDFKAALKVMKKFDRRFLNLTIMAVERQLSSRTLFACPGLRSTEGHDVVYMRMQRYSPKEDAVSTIIDTLVYVMNTMMEGEETCTDGIALVSNMSGFKMHNFSLAYFHKFVLALQGRKLPTRVNMWLLVNPPAWFGSIWQIMKPMMTEDFKKRVIRVNERDMGQFMQKGYANFLPDDMENGKANSEKIILDFIRERKKVEGY